MKYLVRLNPRALNPITMRIDPKVRFEVEQCANKDSEKVVWHCAEVKVSKGLLGTERTILAADFLDTKQSPEVEFYGIVVRGQDNAICIREGRHEAD